MSSTDGVLLAVLGACTPAPTTPTPPAACEPVELVPREGPGVAALGGSWKEGGRESRGFGSTVALADGRLLSGIPIADYVAERVGLSNRDFGERDALGPPAGHAFSYGFGAWAGVVEDVSGGDAVDFVLGYESLGRLDLVDVRHRERTASGDPPYTHFVERPGDRPLRAARCGDLDLDGRADLCTTGGVWLGPVGEHPPSAVRWEVVSAIGAGELDGDGVADLVLGEGDRVWWVTDALGRRGEVSLDAVAADSVEVSGPVTALTTADLDGDCAQEVVIGTATAAVVGRVEGGAFVELTRVEGAVDALTTGDFDGDGVFDVVIGGASEVRWLRGASSPPEVVVFRSDQWPDDRLGVSVSSTDADGDGVWELAIGAPDHVTRERDYTYGNGEWVESLGGAVWWFEGLP